MADKSPSRITNTTIGVSREAKMALDEVSLRSGLSRLQLANEAILMAYDPGRNGRLLAALNSLSESRTNSVDLFMRELLGQIEEQDDEQG